MSQRDSWIVVCVPEGDRLGTAYVGPFATERQAIHWATRQGNENSAWAYEAQPMRFPPYRSDDPEDDAPDLDLQPFPDQGAGR